MGLPISYVRVDYPCCCWNDYDDDDDDDDDDDYHYYFHCHHHNYDNHTWSYMMHTISFFNSFLFQSLTNDKHL